MKKIILSFASILILNNCSTYVEEAINKEFKPLVPSIAEIRSFETSILLDAQKSNLMINVKKTMKDEKIDIAIRRAALHALRRIFTKFLDENKMTLTSDMKNLNEKTKHNINNSNEKDKID